MRAIERGDEAVVNMGDPLMALGIRFGLAPAAWRGRSAFGVGRRVKSVQKSSSSAISLLAMPEAQRSPVSARETTGEGENDNYHVGGLRQETPMSGTVLISRKRVCRHHSPAGSEEETLGTRPPALRVDSAPSGRLRTGYEIKSWERGSNGGEEKNNRSEQG
jgi:hypothetical protein